MHQVGFDWQQKVFNMSEMHVEPSFLCDYVTSRNSYNKHVMTSTDKSKHIFKNHKLH